MKRNTLHASILLLLSLLVSAGALAQTSAPKYGINSFSSVVVTSMDLQVDQSTTSFGTDPVNGHRYLTSAGLFYAPVHLPEGARIGGPQQQQAWGADKGAVEAALQAILGRAWGPPLPWHGRADIEAQVRARAA